MDQYFMDQIITSREESEGMFLPNGMFDTSIFPEPTPDQLRIRELEREAEDRANTCPRCGGYLHYGSCDCTLTVGPWGEEEWS